MPTLGIFFRRRVGFDGACICATRFVKKDGKVHRYWRLVRSVRVGRRVIQQTVAHLGELDEHGRIEARALARQLIGAPEQAQLFNDGNEACDGAGAFEGRPHRALASVRRCISGAGAMARHRS